MRSLVRDGREELTTAVSERGEGLNRSTCLVVGSAVLLMCVGAVPAAAHDPANYPYAWSYTILDRVFFIKNPAGWPGGPWNTRFQDAMAEWNGVSGASLSSSLAGNADPSDDACGPRDLITYGSVDGPGHFIAVTVW